MTAVTSARENTGYLLSDCPDGASLRARPSHRLGIEGSGARAYPARPAASGPSRPSL